VCVCVCVHDASSDVTWACVYSALVRVVGDDDRLVELPLANARVLNPGEMCACVCGRARVMYISCADKRAFSFSLRAHNSNIERSFTAATHKLYTKWVNVSVL
jgi:hypothetical protein